MKQMLIGNSVLQDKVAILEDGELIEYFYKTKSENNCLGNVYKGKVVNVLPGIQAAFVDIGMSKNAYLFIDSLLSKKYIYEKKIKRDCVNNIRDVIKKGDELLVQIVREPISGKNPSVTTDISISGKYTVLVPGNKKIGISKKITDENERKRLKEIGDQIIRNNIGIIFRTYSSGKDIAQIKHDYDNLVSKYMKIEEEYQYSYSPKLIYKDNLLIERIIRDYLDETINEIYVEDNITKEKVEEVFRNNNIKIGIKVKTFKQHYNLFEYFKVEKQIEQLIEKKVKLKSGGSIIIERTEALTVIDVNSGSFVGNKDIEDTAFIINVEAAKEIVRQIKLRNITGIVIVDFISMKTKKHTRELVAKVKEFFKNDKVKTSILGMTKLNLLEMTRKRDKESIFSDLIDTCTFCDGSGKVISPLLISLKIEDIMKRLNVHTTCEAAIIRVNNHVYKILKSELENTIKVLEKTYNKKLFIEKSYDLDFNEIKVVKMGKLGYIMGCKQ